MKRVLSGIWNIALSEYRQWLMQPRILTIGVLVIFTYQLSILPLLERAEKMGEPLNVLEPFITVGNSSQLIMLIPFTFLILFSDYPRVSSNSLLVLPRTGKQTWLAGQLLFAVCAILTFLSVLLLGSIVCCTDGTVSAEWSDAVKKYVSVYPNEYGSFASMLLPSNLYNQIPLLSAFFMTFIYLFCYLFVLMLILYLFRLLHAESFGLLAAVLVIACGVFTCALRTKWMWLFPMAHTVPWLHYEEILRKPVFPIWLTNLYWGVLIAAGLLGNVLAIRKQKFI